MSKTLFVGTASGLELWVDDLVLEKLRQEREGRLKKLLVRDGDKRAGGRPIELAIQEIWNHVRVSGDCWAWHGPRDWDGYGITYINGKSWRANRLIFWLVNGTLKNGNKDSVLHTCDNPPCVKPVHLFLGNESINSLDAYAKGRRKPPMHQCLFSDDEVRMIRARYKCRDKNDNAVAIARELGKPKILVWAIAVGDTYQHVT